MTRFTQRVVTICTLLFVLLLTCKHSSAFGNGVEIKNGVIGEDKVPFSVTLITNEAGPDEWLRNTYSDNESLPVHYHPETVIEFKVSGKNARGFKTWEHENYVQNLLIEQGKWLVLYKTPHGDFNPDGSVVFQNLLDITLPESGSVITDDHEHEPFANAPMGMVITADKFGTKVGSYNGVDAYSNGSVSYYSGQQNYYNGYYTGIKWQCVEYADRYFYAKFGKKITGGNANTYYSNASSKGLNRAANGSTNKPQTGNILCSAGGSYGHVAIIREVGSNYVKVIQQNWNNTSSDNSKSLSMTVSNGKYTVAGFSSSYPVQGWLWPK